MTNYSRMNDAETNVLPVIKDNSNNFQLNPKQYLTDQNQEYMKYMTGNSYVSNNGRNELKEGQTFNFIRVVDIKTCKSDPPLYDAVYNEILGIEEYIDAHEGNTMNGLLGTGQWASFDPLALNYMVKPCNITGKLNYNDNNYPTVESCKLNGDAREIAHSDSFDNLTILLPSKEYIEEHKDKLGYGPLHAAIAGGKKNDKGIIEYKKNDKANTDVTVLTEILNYKDCDVNQQLKEKGGWKGSEWQISDEEWLGPTPLHVAIEKHDLNAVKELLARGAKTDIKSTKHGTQMEQIDELLKENKKDKTLVSIRNYMRFPANAANEMISRMEAEKARFDNIEAPINLEDKEKHEKQKKHLDDQIKATSFRGNTIILCMQYVDFAIKLSLVTAATFGLPVFLAIGAGISNLINLVSPKNEINKPSEINPQGSSQFKSNQTSNDPTVSAHRDKNVQAAVQQSNNANDSQDPTFRGMR